MARVLERPALKGDSAEVISLLAMWIIPKRSGPETAAPMHQRVRVVGGVHSRECWR